MSSVRRRLTMSKISELIDPQVINNMILGDTVNALIELTGAGAIGSYALLAHKNSGVGGSVGDIFAADELYYVGFQTSDSERSWTNSYPIAASGIVAGNTWELCGKTEAVATTDTRLCASLFRRIS